MRVPALKAVGRMRLDDVCQVLCAVPGPGLACSCAGSPHDLLGCKSILKGKVDLCGPGSPCVPARLQLPIESNPEEPRAQLEKVAPLPLGRGVKMTETDLSFPPD